MKRMFLIGAVLITAFTAAVSVLGAHEPMEIHTADHGVGRATERATAEPWAQITTEVIYQPVEYKAPEYGDRRAVTAVCTDEEL